MIARLKQLLAHERMPIVAALLAIVLLLPTLATGMIMDDHSHKMLSTSTLGWPGVSKGGWDLFRFLDDTPGAVKFVKDRGLFPWWTADGFYLAFFRPIASLLHALDYRLWPNAHAWMHLESVLIFATAVFFAGHLYRRLLGATVCAGLATLMFAVDDAHAMVLTWIANRHSILSLVFGIAALVAYDKARKDDWKPGSYLGPLAVAASMSSGESGISTYAYLFAYAVFLDEAPWKARLKSLLPYAAVAIAWLVVYKVGGYGAGGGAFYIDPLGQTSDFLKAVVVRMPVLLTAQLAAPPADVWMALSPEKTKSLTFVCLGILCILSTGFFAVFKRNKTTWFFAVGMVLSLFPACATWPGDRNLLFAGVGGFGLVAQLLSVDLADVRRVERVMPRVIGGVFVLLHLVVAPLFLPLRAYATGSMLHKFTDRAISSFPGDAALKDHSLFIVSAPDSVIVNTVVASRANDKRPHPEPFRVLATAVQGSMSVLRIDERTLSITLSAGYFHEPTSLVFRDPAKAQMRTGDKFVFPGMTVEIKSTTQDGKVPLRIDFQFDKPLEDPSFTWIYWEKTRFAPFTLPKVGEEKAIPVVPYGDVIGG